MDAALYVDDMLVNLKPGSLLIMTIAQGKSGDFYAYTAINELSVDIDETQYNVSMTT